jgi:hypothetical protein
MPAVARRRPLRAIAALIAVGLAVTGCTTTDAAGGGGASLEPLGAVPGATALDDIAADIPEAPEAAAHDLMALVRGPDRDRAVAATTEILRRAGFPIVTADGHVLALPDTWIARNHSIYAEFVPALTAHVRADSGYDASDVADFLTAVGVSGEAFDENVVVGAFAHWGKNETDIPETRFAGAVARESGWLRGEIFAPGATAPRIDPLQLMLFVGHATALTVPIPTDEPAGGKGMSRGTPLGWIGDTCQALTTQSDKELTSALDDPSVKDGIDKILGSAPDSGELAKQTNDLLRAYGRDALRDGVKEGIRAFGEGTGKRIVRRSAEAVTAGWDRAFFTYDLATDTLSAALLLLGARISLTSDDSIHFWHDDNPSMKFTATASFSSPLAAARLSCASLLGVTVPPDGPLTDFKVRWSLLQDTMPSNNTATQLFLEGKFLAPLKGEGRKTRDGDDTDASGRSTLLTIPRQEKEPGVGVLHTAAVTAKVKLDKDEFPFKLKDLMSLAKPSGIGGAAIGKVIELAQQLLTKLGLPSAYRTVTVEYHAPDIYTIDGDGRLSFLFTGIEYFTTQAYSCDGLTGPWHANATFTAAIGPATETAASLLSVPITQREVNLRADDVVFTLEKTTAQQRAPLDMENISLSITLTELPGDDQPHLDGVVGTGTWSIDDADADQLLAYKPIAMFSSGLRYPITGVDRHPGCPGGLDEDEFFPY